MEERKRDVRDIIKWGILILCILVFVYSRLPLEHGNTKGALKRNYIRTQCLLPWQVSVETVEDFSLWDGRETMRAVVYEENDGRNFLYWYRLDEQGNYVISEMNGQAGTMEWEGVLRFSTLHLNGEDNGYNIYYVKGEDITELTLHYTYQPVLEEKTEAETTVQVEKTPAILCLPDPWEQPFAPKVPEGKVKTCSVQVSASN